MTTVVTPSNTTEHRPPSGTGVNTDVNRDDTKKDIKSDTKYDINGNPATGSGYSGNVKKSKKEKIVRPNIPNVRNRKAPLHTQAPRVYGILDRGDRSETFDKITFKPPEKPFVEAHSFWIKAAFTGGGAAIGGIVGSAVPIIGTAIGIAVGAAAGRLAGHLIKKYGRSHSDRRYSQNAINSLKRQGIKLTKKELARLDNMRPEQWKYLGTYRGQIVDELQNYCEVETDDRRWANEFFYQYAALNVARYGYNKTQHFLYGLRARTLIRQGYDSHGNRKTVWGWSSDKLAREMLKDMEEIGGDTFAITRQAKTRRGVQRVDAAQAAAKQKWQQLKSDFQDAFGADQVKRFEDKYARQLELGTEYSRARSRFDSAKTVKDHFRRYIEPYLDQYDKEIQDRLLKLLNNYAVEGALGDLERGTFLGDHNTYDRKRIEEFINTADRLQRAEDRKNGSNGKVRVSADVLIGRATLENRLSEYADASDRNPRDLYGRFVNGAIDLYDECDALLNIPKGTLPTLLAQDSKKPDSWARVNAANLIQLAELGKALKDSGLDSDTARMLLRMEATERGVKTDTDWRNKNVRTIIPPGWSERLADPLDNTLKQDAVDAARQAAADAKKLYKALRIVPSLSHLTRREAEEIIFSLVSQKESYDVSDCDVWRTLTKNNFARLKTILKSGMDAGKTYENMLKGGLSVKDAIECTRLQVSGERVAKIRNARDQTKYAAWRKKGFTDIEIAAYRMKLVIWESKGGTNPPDPLNPAVRYDTGWYIGPNDPKMGFFRGSGLTAKEANRLLWLDLVPERKVDPSPLNLRHRSESKVLSEQVIGSGTKNDAIKREVKSPSGKVDTRVFKDIPGPEKYLTQTHTKALVGSNLGVSMVNEELGFSAIVHTQLSVRKDRVGISMELAKGHTATSLQEGDVFLPVPQDESHYAQLNQAVKDDLEEYGAISEATRKRAFEKYGFTRLKMVGQELQAAGDFMEDLLNDPEFQRMVVELQIIDFLTDELDRHRENFLIDVRLGPKGATAVAVKGVDNDGAFAAHDYNPNSIRTPPRVMSRRQADAIRMMYKDRRSRKGILRQLSRVVAPSWIHTPIKPDSAFQFQNSRDLTAADLKVDRSGDQVTLFEKRLAQLVHHINAAVNDASPTHADGAPVLTIINEDKPDKEVKVDLDNNRETRSTGWGSDGVTKLLKNTSSIVATCDALQP